MEVLKKSKTALLVIDVQNFYWKDESHDEYIKTMQELLDFSRKEGVTIIYVKHVWGNSPEDSIFNIREEIEPQAGEQVVIKRTPGSFFDTGLEELLKSKGIENIIITGMKTNHCCDTTTREASARGYKTYVMSDGVRTFDITGIDGNVIPRETIQYVTLAILQGFAKVVPFEDFKHFSFE